MDKYWVKMLGWNELGRDPIKSNVFGRELYFIAELAQ